MVNIFTRFLGLNDKKQREKGEAVSDYVNSKKNKFTADMIKIQTQAKIVHEKTLQAREESTKIMGVVNDITKQIAKATPGGKK